MSDSPTAGHALEAAGALLTATIFGGFYRAYHKPLIREWALSWAALRGGGAGAATDVLPPRSPDLPNPLRLGSAGTVGAAIVLDYTTDPNGQSMRFLSRPGLRGIIMGFAFFGDAAHGWVTRGVRAIGRRMVGAAFVVFGALQFQFLTLGILAKPTASLSL